MKTNNFTLHILLVSSILMIAVGLLVLIDISVGTADLMLLWPWLFCLPVGCGGLLFVAREYKQ